MWSYAHRLYGLGHGFIIWMVSTTQDRQCRSQRLHAIHKREMESGELLSVFVVSEWSG